MEDTTKILVIDDEQIVLNSCLKIFSQIPDFDIDTALSGAEGLEKTEAKRYDLVITDLKIPDINGMEILKTLRRKQPGVTIIIFTGYATVESVREALKLGAFDYIPKPFTPEELLDVVTNAIKARQNESDVKMLDTMAIVSHELKSPVSVVHTTADILLKGYLGKLAPEQKETVETIIRNCEYLEDVIRNYIDLSKMDIDDLESFKKDIDLVRDVIQPILEMPEYQKNMKNIKITTDFKVTPKVYGDPNLLKIVITNLVNNAIKYGNPATTLTVTLSGSSDEYICNVYNEGVGISKKEIEQKLFKKFSRLKQKGTEGVKGSGLGLYICKTIIEKHKGKIWAESDEGKWTKVSFSLPKR